MPSNSQRKTLVEREIEVLFTELRNHTVGSDEYNTLFDQIVKMSKLKAEEKPPRINPDTLVVAGTNLLGILMVLNYERLNVITTKAMSFVLKPR